MMLAKLLLIVCGLCLLAGVNAARKPRPTRAPSPVLKNCGRSVPEKPSFRIVGGNFVKHGQYPWMVSLWEIVPPRTVFKHVCGAAILNENWVITAAHCFDTPDAHNFGVLLGLHKLSKWEEDSASFHRVAKLVLHDYDRNTQENDIALLRLSRPIDIAGSKGYINGICLPTNDDDPTGNATVIGWGHEISAGENSNILKAVSVPMVSRLVCNEAYRRDENDTEDSVTESMICAGNKGEDSCQNDSGGPLFQIINGIGVLVGIVSHGAGCGLEDFPGVYTKVSSFTKWIEYQTKEKSWISSLFNVVRQSVMI